MKQYLPFFLIHTLAMAILFIAVPIPMACASSVIADKYEPDNSGPQATVYDVSAYMGDENKAGQIHNFHHPGDEDWVAVYAGFGYRCNAKVYEIGADCDVVLSLYDDHLNLISTANQGGLGEIEELGWKSIGSGIYYIKITHASSVLGKNKAYTFASAHRADRASSVFSAASSPSSMYCWGKVTDAVSGNPIGGVEITARYCDSTGSEDRRATSFQDGSYVIYTTILGSYKINVNAPGYQGFVASIEFDNSFSRIDLHIPLVPEDKRVE
ncbi:MAG: carboxypeptidase regulatory-like domain-containing protein [Desulfobacterales bacterium]|nr:carboxypeptidase regulatory-like domain-containing protein [Desulfobacterales bacterium]